jgi:hypothetical protein
MMSRAPPAVSDLLSVCVVSNYAMVKDGFVSPDMEAELSGGAV